MLAVRELIADDTLRIIWRQNLVDLRRKKPMSPEEVAETMALPGAEADVDIVLEFEESGDARLSTYRGYAAAVGADLTVTLSRTTAEGDTVVSSVVAGRDDESGTANLQRELLLAETDDVDNHTDRLAAALGMKPEKLRVELQDPLVSTLQRIARLTNAHLRLEIGESQAGSHRPSFVVQQVGYRPTSDPAPSRQGQRPHRTGNAPQVTPR